MFDYTVYDYDDYNDTRPTVYRSTQKIVRLLCRKRARKRESKRGERERERERENKKMIE